MSMDPESSHCLPLSVDTTLEQDSFEDLIRLYDTKVLNLRNNNSPKTNDIEALEVPSVLVRHLGSINTTTDLSANAIVPPVLLNDLVPERRSTANLHQRYSNLPGRSDIPKSQEPQLEIKNEKALKIPGEPQNQDNECSTSSALPLPSKIAINTTISYPQTPIIPSHYPTIPPVITQYPPKPLKYSPVEPLENSPEDGQGLRKRAIHRISIPFLRLSQEAGEDRRRSESDLSQHRFGPIGKKAKRLTQWLVCRPSKKSRNKQSVSLY
ncbi:hypothetical protein CLU79DRAFT_781762 [Phycomyces nitens]|nr:hypothetical protein CLU79DRAFT_781762 [Phycomyces nitens]